jgi:hypothetical protein
MYHANKIATCCYCGNRTVLNLTGKVRHELACASCGAPLRRMKNLPAEPAAPRRPEMATEPYRPRPQKTHPQHRPDWTKPGRRRKRLASRLIDLAEDVFDIFD